MRKDFASLCEIPHRCVHMTRDRLIERAEIIFSEMKRGWMTLELSNEIEAAYRALPKRIRDKL
jgi:hypothetical protein